MQSYLVEMLVCPMCHGELQWQMSERRGERIETAQAHCAQCATVYPVREGVGLFLSPDLPREDLWQEVDSQLVRHLREHPEVAQRLMASPAARSQLFPSAQINRFPIQKTQLE